MGRYESEFVPSSGDISRKGLKKRRDIELESEREGVSSWLTASVPVPFVGIARKPPPNPRVIKNNYRFVGNRRSLSSPRNEQSVPGEREAMKKKEKKNERSEPLQVIVVRVPRHPC